MCSDEKKQRARYFCDCRKASKGKVLFVFSIRKLLYMHIAALCTYRYCLLILLHLTHSVCLFFFFIFGFGLNLAYFTLQWWSFFNFWCQIFFQPWNQLGFYGTKSTKICLWIVYLFYLLTCFIQIQPPRFLCFYIPPFSVRDKRVLFYLVLFGIFLERNQIMQYMFVLVGITCYTRESRKND